MGKEFHFKLDGLDLGQMLDGLRCRQESWANTAIYLRDEYFPDDSFVCEECSDADEAQKIADHYQRIITAIERQIDEQARVRNRLLSETPATREARMLPSRVRSPFDRPALDKRAGRAEYRNDAGDSSARYFVAVAEEGS